MRAKALAAVALIALPLGAPALVHAAPGARPPIVLNTDGFGSTLEPPNVIGTFNAWALLHLGERMIEEQLAGKIEPGLAAHWDVAPDFKRVSFELAPGHRFCDGAPVDSGAIEKWWRLARPKGLHGRLGAFYSRIASIRATGPMKIEIRLASAVPDILQVLSDPLFTIYRKGADGSLCFTGHYDLVKFTPSELAIVRKSDRQEFIWKVMEFKDALDAFRRGEVHVLTSYSYKNPKEIQQVASHTVESPDGKVVFFAFNSRNGIFREKKAREDFIRSFDTASLDAAIKSWGLRENESLMGPMLSDWKRHALPPADSKLRFPGGGRRLRVLVQTGHEMQDLLRAALPSHFSDLEIIEADKPTFLSHVRNGTYDVILIAFGGITRDWDQIGRFFEPTSPYDFARVNDPTELKWLAQLKATPSESERLEMVHKILDRNNQEDWYYPVAYLPLVFGLSDRLSVNAPELQVNSLLFLDLDWLSLK